jgi:hypothetical protein
MTNRSPRAPGRGGRAAVRARLRDPAVLTIVAVVFLVSAVGQAVVQRLVDDRSIVVTAVLSVLGSFFLAAAIVVGARRRDP